METENEVIKGFEKLNACDKGTLKIESPDSCTLIFSALYNTIPIKLVVHFSTPGCLESITSSTQPTYHVDFFVKDIKGYGNFETNRNYLNKEYYKLYKILRAQQKEYDAQDAYNFLMDL